MVCGGAYLASTGGALSAESPSARVIIASPLRRLRLALFALLATTPACREGACERLQSSGTDPLGAQTSRGHGLHVAFFILSKGFKVILCVFNGILGQP